uniref:SJCHGC07479 protein n=1 Tax=Schistosoma japonicum TaxID=6182 RepID=Q3KTH6_SCHJA|nr:SJCHGC07479 protein [Schistosoma japonicum]
MRVTQMLTYLENRVPSAVPGQTFLNLKVSEAVSIMLFRNPQYPKGFVFPSKLT